MNTRVALEEEEASHVGEDTHFRKTVTSGKQSLQEGSHVEEDSDFRKTVTSGKTVTSRRQSREAYVGEGEVYTRVALEEEALFGTEDPAAHVIQRVEVLAHLDQASGFI